MNDCRRELFIVVPIFTQTGFCLTSFDQVLLFSLEAFMTCKCITAKKYWCHCKDKITQVFFHRHTHALCVYTQTRTNQKPSIVLVAMDNKSPSVYLDRVSPVTVKITAGFWLVKTSAFKK